MVLYNSSVGGRPWPPCARESALQNTKAATYKRMDRTRFIGTPGTESSLGTGTHAGNWRFLNGFLKKWRRLFRGLPDQGVRNRNSRDASAFQGGRRGWGLVS